MLKAVASRLGWLASRVRRAFPMLLVVGLLVGFGLWREQEIRTASKEKEAALDAQLKSEQVSFLELRDKVNGITGLGGLAGRVSGAEGTIRTMQNDLSTLRRAVLDAGGRTFDLAGRFNAMLALLAGKVSLLDVKVAMARGLIDVPASAIQQPFLCSNKTAVWSLFYSAGLAC